MSSPSPDHHPDLICPHCSYPILESTAEVTRCSECGADLDLVQLRRALTRDRPQSHDRAYAAAILTCVLGVISLGFMAMLLSSVPFIGEAGAVISMMLLASIILLPLILSARRGRDGFLAYVGALAVVFFTLIAVVATLLLLTGFGYVMDQPMTLSLWLLGTLVVSVTLAATLARATNRHCRRCDAAQANIDRD